MKPGTQSTMQEVPLFTVADHLRVQQQIEQRANELWRARGCRDQSALSDWLRAEREVLEQFVLAYALGPSMRREANRRPTAPAKARNSKTRSEAAPANKSRKQTPTTTPL